MGIYSTKTSKSGARGGMGDRLLVVWRILLCDLFLFEASCLHAYATSLRPCQLQQLLSIIVAIVQSLMNYYTEKSTLDGLAID